MKDLNTTTTTTSSTTNSNRFKYKSNEKRIIDLKINRISLLKNNNNNHDNYDNNINDSFFSNELVNVWYVLVCV